MSSEFRWKTTEELRQALDLLGLTSSGIANSLINMGLKGERGSSCYCPLVRYLEKCGFHTPRVEPSKIFINNYSSHIATPYHIASFLAHFDFGQYPKLDTNAR